MRSLQDVIAFNEREPREALRVFDQDLLLKAQDRGPLTDAAYRTALATDQRLSRDEGLDVVFATMNLDAIVAPTGNPPCAIDAVNGDHFLGSSSTPAAVAGYPSITVPVGFVFGLPVGLSFIGKPRSEPLLIKLAFALEQATKARRPPRFLPTRRSGGGVTRDTNGRGYRAPAVRRSQRCCVRLEGEGLRAPRSRGVHVVPTRHQHVVGPVAAPHSPWSPG